MSVSAIDPLTALETLRQRLDEVADALAKADLTALLDTEMRLASAVSQVCAPLPSTIDRTQISRALNDTAQALHRCRRLGASLSDTARLALASMGGENSYDRTAQGGPASVRTFNGSM